MGPDLNYIIFVKDIPNSQKPLNDLYRGYFVENIEILKPKNRITLTSYNHRAKRFKRNELSGAVANLANSVLNIKSIDEIKILMVQDKIWTPISTEFLKMSIL